MGCDYAVMSWRMYVYRSYMYRVWPVVYMCVCMIRCVWRMCVPGSVFTIMCPCVHCARFVCRSCVILVVL